MTEFFDKFYKYYIFFIFNIINYININIIIIYERELFGKGKKYGIIMYNYYAFNSADLVLFEIQVKNIFLFSINLILFIFYY